VSATELRISVREPPDVVYHSPPTAFFPLDREAWPIHTGNMARYDRDVLMSVFLLFEFVSKQGVL